MVRRKNYLWRHPKGYWYVRTGGKYHRIIAREGTPEFDRQYWEILNGKRAESKTSWKALIASYRNSDHWQNGLKPRTRTDYEKVLIYLTEKIGTKDVTKITRKAVIEAQEANKHRVRFANYIPQVMSVLVEHAIDKGWMEANPAKGVRRLKTPSGKAQPHIPWTDEAVKKWRADAAALPRLIFEIGVGSVQRPGDWPLFTWGDYDGDSLRLVQGKTDKPLYLPCTAALRAELDRAKAEITPHPARTIIADEKGRALSYRTMARIMREERERLGLLRYDQHALRYRGVMELAWSGCDDDEIASYSGHASKAMIRKYAGEARQIMRARQAREKRQ